MSPPLLCTDLDCNQTRSSCVHQVLFPASVPLHMIFLWPDCSSLAFSSSITFSANFFFFNKCISGQNWYFLSFQLLLYSHVFLLYCLLYNSAIICLNVYPSLLSQVHSLVPLLRTDFSSGSGLIKYFYVHLLISFSLGAEPIITSTLWTRKLRQRV